MVYDTLPDIMSVKGGINYMNNIRIETERLLLRPLTGSDAEAVFEWVSDERVSKYMVYHTYRSVEQVIQWIRSLETDTEEYHFAFARKRDGKLIGSGSIGPDAENSGFWGFGYNLRYDCWGYGYATEAAKAMINYVHENLGIRKFSSSHAEPNTASGNVMKKCGLHFAGYGEFQKLDGSCRLRSVKYEGEL